MKRDHLLAIDQGTTSTRALLYNAELEPIGQAQIEVPPTYPRPGWVEHDATAIAGSMSAMVARVLAEHGISPQRIAAVGITNQRETTVIWDRSTGEPIAPALVWQDRRTADLCASPALQARREEISRRTGLVLDPYFSATKIAWLLDNVPGARRRAEAGDLIAGTIDTWLVWRLTGGQHHVVDVTNASRMLLMDLDTCQWSNDLCGYFAVPPRILPRIVPSSGIVGETQGCLGVPDGLPIAGIAGDQQASLAGQGGFGTGLAKCTYGTGAFLLAHTGSKLLHSRNGLITTAAARAGADAGQPAYALEGSVFIAGAAVQWFRDGLKAVGAAPEIDRLCLDADPLSGVLFVPALTGLGAPHWLPDACGTIFGLTRATSLADLARATLEGVAYQVADLIQAVQADLPTPLTELRVDGGMARSDPFLQFQADLTGLTLRRSPQTESTALGAAILAGMGVGLWPDLESVQSRLAATGQVFQPQKDDAWRGRAMSRWDHAVQTVTRHYRETPE